MTIGALVTVVAVGLTWLGHPRRFRGATLTYPPASRAVPPADPIAAEADVFRETGGPPIPSGIPEHAHMMTTLAIYRSLRAYPGAPPRIPHGLTGEEHRDSECLVCHARGGFVARFAAYAPVTPHPEYTECQQCHLPDARLVGIAPPVRASEASCGQCHVDLDAPPPMFVATDWRPAAWPPVGVVTADASPPPIPHGFQLRSNCQACHAGPGALENIRTTHPEWTSCRQCHLPATPEGAAFVRPLDLGPAPGEGGQ